jgi:hypothetical protein
MNTRNISWGVKAATFMCRLSWNLGVWTCWNPLQAFLYLLYVMYLYSQMRGSYGVVYYCTPSVVFLWKCIPVKIGIIWVKIQGNRLYVLRVLLFKFGERQCRSGTNYRGLTIMHVFFILLVSIIICQVCQLTISKPESLSNWESVFPIYF